MKKNKLQSIDLLLFLMVTIWGFNFSVLKIILREFLPMSFNILRFTAASLATIFFLFMLGKKISIDKHDWVKIILLAVIGHTCYQLLFIYGINATTASNASLLMACVPIYTGIMSSIAGYEKVRPTTWISIFLSFFGIFLIISADAEGLDFSSSHFKGNILIILASLSWAIYTVVAAPLLKKYSPVKLTAITMSIGTLLLVPFSIKELSRQNWQNISTLSWLGFIYSFLLAIALGYVIWYKGVEKIGSTRTSIYSNLTPIFTAFFAWLLLSETITVYYLIGASVIFLGIYLSRINKAKNRLKEI
jgi:drug/metabolite transporter (DMT)-like permease